jgi:S1-C subfamily serine protease
MARYNHACDNLRKVLAELHLPDPGDALPPPEGARLGVQAIGGFDDNAAVTIGHVMPGSRAGKIGLMPGDVIEVVNGAQVHGVKELRRLVTEHTKGLVVEGTRNGRKLRLEEKQ